MKFIKDKICTQCQRALPLRDTPWLTNQAKDFLVEWFKDKKDPKVLEFGAGGSTIWFSKRTKNLTTIESQADWFGHAKDNLDSQKECNSVDLRLIPMDYYQVCNELDNESFDLVLIDARYRVKCIEASRCLLKPGGILMLDNADRCKYSVLDSLMEGWQFTKTVQEEPDDYGYFYENWQTNWWIKPKN